MTAYRIEQLEKCHREMFGDMVLTCQTPIQGELPKQQVQPMLYTIGVRRASADSVSVDKRAGVDSEKRRASALVDELLMDIYYSVHNGSTDYNSTSGKSHKSSWVEVVNLEEKVNVELISILSCLNNYTERMGSVLVRQLKRRDALRRQQEAYCDVITKKLMKCVPQGTTPEDMRFTIQPLSGDTGFSQWSAAMKMVAQLPGGIPPEFRKRLWLTLAEGHLAAKGVNWPEVERTCFSEWSHPTDAELGVQIVKDLHRTGCSLFCGENGQENQALLKRVLLAYARWNKAVGYCQGFNMLAALILQVTERCESDALKLMIYLVEGVLPDSYFADSLRGLSVDMAVFRELLRSRLPRLSKHLDALQNAAKDGSRSYEPPLTNVFTMQWFLTLFCNCLPQPTVLRVWDLILLEGNEILLRTALAIWQVLAERIQTARSADEFYCIMGVLMRELLEFGLIDGNSLIKAVVSIGPLTELKTLREHYLYNINPWGAGALPQQQLKLYPRHALALDISALKKQYSKLKQRQRQAHIIFSAAISRQPPAAPAVAMNHLLIGKSALVPAKRLGPPKGSIPPARQAPGTLHWKDAPRQSSSSSSSDTELCDDESDSSSSEDDAANDNLPPDGDASLMRNDNTRTSLRVDEDFGSQIEEAVAESKSDEDEDNFDFEQFLADRVKCLKVDVEEPEERINCARRNSERALQIIQENSLILHRILQCQSRLSPSNDLENVSSLPLNEEEDTTDDEVVCGSPQALEAVKSPEYGSKYTSILEKSKSLDEKYNALILNKPVSRTAEELSSHSSEKIYAASSLSLPVSPISRSKERCESEMKPSKSNIMEKSYENLPIVVEESTNDSFLDSSVSEGSIRMLSSVDVYKIHGKSLDFYHYCECDAEQKRENLGTPKEVDMEESLSYFKASELKTDFDSELNVNFNEEKVSRNVSSDATTPPGTASNINWFCSPETDDEKDNESNDITDSTFSYNETEIKQYSSFFEASENSICGSFLLAEQDSKTCYNYLGAEKTLELPSLSRSSEGTEEILDYSLDLPLRSTPFSCEVSVHAPGGDDKSLSPLNEEYSLYDKKTMGEDGSFFKPPVQSALKSPLRSPLKSPSKCFNPFPVPLGSRQNKEVPLKLGLYKK